MNKKGIFLTLDGILSTLSVLVIVTWISFTLATSDATYLSSSDQMLGPYARSLYGSGQFNTSIVATNTTMLQSWVDVVNASMCLNITVLSDSGSSVMSAVTSGCGIMSEDISAHTSYIYANLDNYEVRMLGWYP